MSITSKLGSDYPHRFHLPLDRREARNVATGLDATDFSAKLVLIYPSQSVDDENVSPRLTLTTARSVTAARLHAQLHPPR